jgi:hypothetical protein
MFKNTPSEQFWVSGNGIFAVATECFEHNFYSLHFSLHLCEIIKTTVQINAATYHNMYKNITFFIMLLIQTPHKKYLFQELTFLKTEIDHWVENNIKFIPCPHV